MGQWGGLEGERGGVAGTCATWAVMEAWERGSAPVMSQERQAAGPGLRARPGSYQLASVGELAHCWVTPMQKQGRWKLSGLLGAQVEVVGPALAAEAFHLGLQGCTERWVGSLDGSLERLAAFEASLPSRFQGLGACCPQAEAPAPIGCCLTPRAPEQGAGAQGQPRKAGQQGRPGGRPWLRAGASWRAGVGTDLALALPSSCHTGRWTLPWGSQLQPICSGNWPPLPKGEEATAGTPSLP